MTRGTLVSCASTTRSSRRVPKDRLRLLMAASSDGLTHLLESLEIDDEVISVELDHGTDQVRPHVTRAAAGAALLFGTRCHNHPDRQRAITGQGEVLTE